MQAQGRRWRCERIARERGRERLASQRRELREPLGWVAGEDVRAAP